MIIKSNELIFNVTIKDEKEVKELIKMVLDCSYKTLCQLSNADKKVTSEIRRQYQQIINTTVQTQKAILKSMTFLIWNDYP